MARAETRRFTWRGSLVLRSPLHIGAAGESLLTDQAVAIDGLDRPVIPGTSLAGVFRAWLRTRDMESEDDWGGSPRDAEAATRGDDGKAASRIAVEDAPMLVADSPAGRDRWGRGLAFRDGVAIDRDTGAAADQRKFDRLVVEPGNRFAFEMSLSAGDDTEPAVITTLIHHLATHGLSLGARTNSGMGRVLLEAPVCRVETLSDRSGILTAIRQRLSGGDDGFEPQGASA